MPSSDQDIDPEVEQVINALMSGFAQEDLPAIVILPSESLSTSCDRLAQFLTVPSNKRSAVIC